MNFKVLEKVTNSFIVLCKKGVLRNLAKFTGKHLCKGLFFKKAAGLRQFPVNFAKFLRTPFLLEHL